MNINKVESIVHQIMLFDHQSRNDDNYLYAKVIETYDNIRGTSTQTMTVADYFCDYSSHKMPSYKTVCRVRAKIQETEPSLRADDDVRQTREEYRQEYFDFAVGN